MHNPIQILKTKYKLPIDVATENGHATLLTECVQQVCDWENTDAQYLDIIADLIDAADRPINGWSAKHMAKYVMRYMIQNIIKNYKEVVVENIETTYLKSINQAQRYIDTNPWVFSTGEDENAPPKLDANGNIAPKKGDKKIIAKKVYEEQIKDKVITRKEAIALLVKEVGLTPAGASTYYSNLRNGTY